MEKMIGFAVTGFFALYLYLRIFGYGGKKED